MSDNVFCGGCGKPISRDTSFCGECGTKNDAAVSNPVSVDTPTPPPTDSWTGTSGDSIPSNNPSSDMPSKNPIINPRNIGIVAVSIVVIIVAALISHFVFGNGNSKVVANKFVDAYLTYDGDDMLDLTHEKFLKAYLSDTNTKEAVFEDRISDSSRIVIDSFAEKINVSTRKISDYTTIEIVDITTPNDRAFDEILDQYERYLDIKISDIKVFTYELTFDNETTLYADYNVTVLKIGSNWYWNFLNHTYLL